jgi:hypothetical protein
VSYLFTPFEPLILFVLNFSGSIHNLTVLSDLGQAVMSHDPVEQGGRRADAQRSDRESSRR